MKKNAVLIILYNHKYDKNIEILEEIYHKRFSAIYHLVPFYDGEKPNVIPVYENSRYFQGYIAQGLKQYFKEEYLHYIFIADDLILNPVINENNYHEHFKLKEKTSFLPEFITLHDRNSFWSRVKEAYEYKLNRIGVEANKELPVYHEAIERFERLNLKIEPLRYDQIYPKVILSIQTFLSPKKAFLFMKQIFSKSKHLLMRNSYNLSYPLVGSYSDIVIVSAEIIKQFCHYCGVFAATNLFVELALPTALVLTTEEIVTEKNLLLQGKALWTSEDYKILLKYENQLKKLLSDFPENFIYLHPIKLSKWDTET